MEDAVEAVEAVANGVVQRRKTASISVINCWHGISYDFVQLSIF